MQTGSELFMRIIVSPDRRRPQAWRGPIHPM